MTKTIGENNFNVMTIIMNGIVDLTNMMIEFRTVSQQEVVTRDIGLQEVEVTTIEQYPRW